MIQGLNAAMITGTVTFKEVANGVEMTYALENCRPGVNLTHIHNGTSCQSFTDSLGPRRWHWRAGSYHLRPRREGDPDVCPPEQSCEPKLDALADRWPPT